MMTTCAFCENWAQWRISKAERNEARELTGKLIVYALVCHGHKQVLEQDPPESDLRYAFVGAVPDGVNYPQPR